MKTVTPGFVQELIDFAPTERARRMGFAEAQLNGTVAAFNMLSHNRIAYLADEVGMGKTYVALGVMGLLRHLQPDARICVMTPRENIQLKWVKELTNFVRSNWKVEDNRVKNLHQGPAWEPVTCGSVDSIAHTVNLNDNCDLYLRMTTFSVAAGNREGRKRCRERLLRYLPWVDRQLLNRRDPGEFRDMYGRLLNALMPPLDLLVVDEAHNFKHGFGPRVSNRNRVLGLALGHPSGGIADCPWYGRRVKRVLMLSATPFEYDYADLYRQLDVFGCADESVTDAAGKDPIALLRLVESDHDGERRALAKRFLLRRVQYMNIGGQRHSKNMYRREWRRGGFEAHDEPMTMDDPKQRLVVGLMQKKVSELLGDSRFGSSFQIGMLSSFESFVESMERRQRKSTTTAQTSGDEDEEDESKTFDGDNEDVSSEERRGIDSHSLATVVKSYRERFGRALPHPKLDATVASLKDTFVTGEKALVFCRRVATVGEMRAKLNDEYDQWIRAYIEQMLPAMGPDIDQVFTRYRREKRKITDQDTYGLAVDDNETLAEELAFDIEDDDGGSDSFFTWFFRGMGPKGILSGAAFQRNRLASISSAYSTLFEDDHVCWLLNRPADPISAMAEASGQDREAVRSSLRALAFGYFSNRTQRKEGYPRLYLFEAYQAASLHFLAQHADHLRHKAETVLMEAYEGGFESKEVIPPGFPWPEGVVGVRTFFTELAQRTTLQDCIWPDESHAEFREQFRRREQRRELVSAMSRLGAAYVDLYTLAIRDIGSFDLSREAATPRPEEGLAVAFLDLLEQQMQRDRSSPERTFCAFSELSQAAAAFDTIIAVNFPQVPSMALADLATTYGRTLQHQTPVGQMAGGVNKRLVRQFRMPGYPLVLATTDVLQEGEDLHTFCRRVIHYGITWTPSAMEQRTGRVDRIGSLVQRELDAQDREAEHRELIQVYFPHLRDTVERLQIRRVLYRLNQFLRLVHRTGRIQASRDSRVDVAREALQKDEDIPPIAGLLESDFPVTRAWLDGELGKQDVSCPSVGALEEYFRECCMKLVRERGIHEVREMRAHHFTGIMALSNGDTIRWQQRDDYPHHREQPFQLFMRSQVLGDATLIRCVSPVGILNLEDPETLDGLYDWQRRLGMVRVCAHYDLKHHASHVTVEHDRLMHLDTTQHEEVDDLVIRTALAADRLEEALLDCDEDPTAWLKGQREVAGDR